MKNRIKHYTIETEKRLTDRLKTFIASAKEGRAVFVTLTTTKDDPEHTKGLLKRWLARVRYHYDFCGFYVLEFNQRGLVHYHILLVLSGELRRWRTLTVADKLWAAWETLGTHQRTAFDLKPADLRQPEWVLSYMPKADLEPGVAHPERWQKNLPVGFEARGLGARWWGVIGRSAALDMGLNTSHDGDDSIPPQWDGQEVA